MNIKCFCSFRLFFCTRQLINAQIAYSLDPSKVATDIRSGYFKMGNAGPSGKQILLNSRYMTINGDRQFL